MNHLCPLCQGTSEIFEKLPLADYFKCNACHSVFQSPDNWLSPEAEKARYDTHNNDVDDPRYQNFVSPIVDAIKRDFKTHHHGLDFGAGPGPVISKLLTDANYTISLYDPYYHKNKAVLNQTYDYIVCCEVMEHFYDPNASFALLAGLLNPGGKLYCMTELYYDTINFNKWRYVDDATHVFFYSELALKFIALTNQFHHYTLDNRLIIFHKK